MQKNAHFCILTLLHLSTYQIGAYVNFRQNSQKLNVQASVRTCCILTGLIFRRDTRDEIRTTRSESPTTTHQLPFLLFARKKLFFYTLPTMLSYNSSQNRYLQPSGILENYYYHSSILPILTKVFLQSPPILILP